MGDLRKIFQDGFRKHLVLSPQEVRRRIPVLPLLLQQTRSDPEIRHQHVPSVLPGGFQGHRGQEAQLSHLSFYGRYVTMSASVKKEEKTRSWWPKFEMDSGFNT